MYFFPIYNKLQMKFPFPRVWVMFPKYWKKSLKRVMKALIHKLQANEEHALFRTGNDPYLNMTKFSLRKTF